MPEKRILVFHTGGTISMTFDPGQKRVHPSEEHPLQRSPLSLPGIQLSIHHLFNYPSPHITPELMLTLYKKIKECIGSQPIDGVVVTHGTDTLEETAFLIDLLYDGETPIVFTGAMKSSNEPGADGPANFENAIRVAASPKAKNRGVLVVFQEEIHAARLVAKVHTSKLDAFQSIPHGPIGNITKTDIIFHYSLPREKGHDLEHISKKVVLLKAVAGMEADWVEAVLATKPDGLVFEAFGQGNLPITVLPAIEKAHRAKIPVVITSRCLQGSVEEMYDYPGGGKQLKETGAILAKGLSGPKARLRLMVALELFSELEAIRGYFS